MYVSLRRLFVNMYASAHAQTVCLCYLAQCFQSPRTIVCVSVCICVCVLESLQLSHHIYLFWWLNISASLSSYPLGLHPDRHMSNNAWLESNNTQWKAELAHYCEKHTEDDLLIETRTGWTEFFMLSSITIKYDWELFLPLCSTNEASAMSLK